MYNTKTFKGAIHSIFLLPADRRVSGETCPDLHCTSMCRNMTCIYVMCHNMYDVCFKCKGKMLRIAQLILDFLLFIFSSVK